MNLFHLSMSFNRLFIKYEYWLMKKISLLIIIWGVIGISLQDGKCQLSQKDSLVVADLKNFSLPDTLSLNIYSKKLFTSSAVQKYPEEYKILLKKGLDASIKFSVDRKIAAYYTNLSRACVSASNFNEAIIHLEQAIKKYDEIGDSTRIVNRYLELGAVYNYKGEQLKNLEYLFKALKYYEAHENPIAAFPLNSIAHFYLTHHQIEKGREYANRCISMAERLKFPQKEYLTANAYYFLLRFDEETNLSDFYQEQALKYAQTIDTINLRYAGVAANVYLAVAESAIDSMALDAAKLYLDKIEKINDPFQYTNYHNVLLKYFLAKNDIVSADRTIQKLEAVEYQDQPKDLKGFKTQIDYYLKKGNIELARQKLNELLKLLKVSFNEEHIQYAAYANAIYETDREKAKNAAHVKLQKSQQRQLQIAISLLCLVLLLLIILIYLYKKIQKDKSLILSQAEELKKINESKLRFFTHAAHELRTPLTLITEPLQKTIKHPDLPLEQQQDLQVALKNSLGLKKITTQILNLLKSEREVLPLKVNSFLLEDFIKFIYQKYEYSARQKGIQLLRSVAPSEIVLRTDAEKLLTIVSNLMENAIKFTPEGKTIEVSFSKNEKDLFITIADTGIGIAEKHRSSIFNQYFQVHDANLNNRASGLGIGLAICKEYIKLLGGTIRVESNLEKGTHFYLTVPITHSTVNDTFENDYFFESVLSTAISNSQLTERENNLNQKELKKKLLILEDNEDMRSILDDILKQDYDLKFAANGEEGLKILNASNRFDCDLMIIDLMMPKMNGFQFVETIKKDERYKSTPLIILSALSKDLTNLKMLRFSIDDYIMKPFDKVTLLSRLDYLFKFEEQRRIAKLVEAEGTTQFEDILSTEAEENNLFLLKLEAFTEQNLKKTDLSIEDIAANFNISISTLARKTKFLLGITPKKYITELRYIKAREIIISEEYDSVKSVCYSVGIKNLKNFSKQFKERFGKYPSEYL